MRMVLVGAGGHARALVETIRSRGDEIAVYVDTRGADWLGAPRKASDDEVRPQDGDIVVGIGGMAPDELVRRLALFADYRRRGFGSDALVHPTAWVSATARLGAGSVVLAGAVVALLMLDPSLVWAVGFQLSVAATAGMVALATPIAERMRFLPRPVALAAGATLAAQVGVTPVLLFWFHEVPLSTILANILAFPVVAPSLLLGLLAAGTGLVFEPLGRLLGALALIPMRYLEAVADRLARAPVPWITGGGMATLVVGLLAALALAWWLRSGRRLPRAAIASVLALGLLLLLTSGLAPAAALVGDLAWMAAHALLRSADPVQAWSWLDMRFPSPPLWAGCLFALGLGLLAGRRPRAWLLVLLGGLGILGRPPEPGDGRLHLTVLDVGQGDALVVRSPQGRVWVIDSGGSYDGRFDAGESIVAPYLWSQGHRRIEGLALTHAHPDHLGGARFLLRAFGVGEVWEGVAPRHDRTQEMLEQAFRRTPAHRVSVVRGMRRLWDGVEIEVMAPRPKGRPPWTTRNDDSLVLVMRWGGVSLLLAGDVEAKAEQLLVSDGPVDVLKVPHHGSRSSSSPGWVAGVRPRVAIVSAGFRNHFGHPHREVVARYQATGAWVLRTDRDGAVTVSTNGREVWVRTARDGIERIR